jgi:tetratricopeptide (TPR) repeat protein
VLERFGEDIAAALALIDRALALNPRLCLWLVWSGWRPPLRRSAGAGDRALRDLYAPQSVRSERVPFGRDGQAHFLNHRFEEALAVLRVSLEEVPAFTPAHRTLAACYAHMGRLDEARSILRRLAALTAMLSRLRIHSAARRMASYSYRALGWQPARRYEPDPSSRRDASEPWTTFRDYQGA